jgi:tetratricopeptide (TPR) repeat protein
MSMVRRLLLAGTALMAATAAHAEWYEASSKHFVVYADDRPERIKAYTEKLERFDKAMKVMRGVPEDRRGPAARVTVFQLRDIGEIQKLYGEAGSVAGFYDSRASGSVAFVPRESGGNGAPWAIKADRVLLHEYAHHFMYADWPSAIFPRWFSEGFAEYNSTAIFNADGSVTFGAPPTDRAWGVADINTMPLDRMLDPTLGKLDGHETYALYSRGWALTHYLTQDAERRKQLADYIGAINAGKSLEEAEKPFGNLKALDFKLVSYVKQPRFASQVVPADRLSIGAVTLRRMGPGETATMPILIRSQRGVTPETAPRVAKEARAAAASFPNDPAAQNVLAEAEFDAKHYAEAGAAADRALAVDPKSVHAMLYKGMALQAIAEAAKTSDPQQWQAVRRWYIAANRASVEDPQPLILYYRSFSAAGQQPPTAAQQGMLYAAALAPFDLSLKIDVARIDLLQDKPQEARKALEPLAFSPHGGENATKVREILGTIDKNGSKAALAQIDALTRELAEQEKKGGKKKSDDD